MTPIRASLESWQGILDYGAIIQLLNPIEQGIPGSYDRSLFR